jgi:hypothetical protein
MNHPRLFAKAVQVFKGGNLNKKTYISGDSFNANCNQMPIRGVIKLYTFQK